MTRQAASYRVGRVLLAGDAARVLQSTMAQTVLTRGDERVDALRDTMTELPALGEVTAPPAVLIRPDGHVAWAGDPTDPELSRAFTTWFGPAAPPGQAPSARPKNSAEACQWRSAAAPS